MYIVIEKFPSLSFLRDVDGNILEFDTARPAILAAISECQDGQIVAIGNSRPLQKIIPLVVKLTEKISNMAVTDCFRDNFTHIVENNKDIVDLPTYADAFLELAFAEVGRKHYDDFKKIIDDYLAENQ